MSIEVAAAGASTPNAAHLLWVSAERHGDRSAVVERGSTLTYTSLRDRAAAFGAALSAAGVQANDRVALLLERVGTPRRRSSGRSPRERSPWS